MEETSMKLQQENNGVADEHRSAESSQKSFKDVIYETFGFEALFAQESALKTALNDAVTALPRTQDNEMIIRKIVRELAHCNDENEKLCAYIDKASQELRASNADREKVTHFFYEAGLAQRVLLERTIATLKDLLRLVAPMKAK